MARPDNKGVKDDCFWPNPISSHSLEGVGVSRFYFGWRGRRRVR